MTPHSDRLRAAIDRSRHINRHDGLLPSRIVARSPPSSSSKPQYWLNAVVAPCSDLAYSRAFAIVSPNTYPDRSALKERHHAIRITGHYRRILRGLKLHTTRCQFDRP